jgi:hypothetical protein
MVTEEKIVRNEVEISGYSRDSFNKFKELYRKEANQGFKRWGEGSRN